ncbi:MAG TPA: HD domain-containing protein [Candidatus Limnocylindrales bacterium]|nr:HD domain-containing protein [Candidatus Limnocylindrales bacterium]
MQTDLKLIIEQITTNSLFARLKDIQQNHKGWHDHESIFDHSVKTADIAKIVCEGDFITNPQADQLFSDWINEDLYRLKRKEIVVLTALVHDCGKILNTRDEEQFSTLSVQKPNYQNQNIFPGHEYWGGELVVPKILKDTDLPSGAKQLIASVVKQHGVFSDFFNSRKDWPIKDLINFVKSQAEGYYMESLFNMYCDGFTASGFLYGKKRIEELFNESTLYIKREYFITE